MRLENVWRPTDKVNCETPPTAVRLSDARTGLLPAAFFSTARYGLATFRSRAAGVASLAGEGRGPDRDVARDAGNVSRRGGTEGTKRSVADAFRVQFLSVVAPLPYRDASFRRVGRHTTVWPMRRFPSEDGVLIKQWKGSWLPSYRSETVGAVTDV